jgi:hypothetical protein
MRAPDEEEEKTDGKNERECFQRDPCRQGCQMANLFSYQKSQVHFILEPLGMENVGK